MLTNLGSNDNVKQFLSRILYILPFNPQIKGDRNNLLDIRPLPDNRFLILRASNLNEVHSSRNSKLLQFKDTET